MKKKTAKQPNRTWVEINTKAIETNTQTLKAVLRDEAFLIAVVKSNAYGHGMVMSAKAALNGGANRLAVDELSEALELRAAGIKAPILVLGYTLPDLYAVAAQKNVVITISSLDSLQTLSKMRFAKKPRIHLKFDTGLHRQGIPESQVQQAIRIASNKKFTAIVEGMYTHFAVMESPHRAEYSKSQIRLFNAITVKAQEKGLPAFVHASASSGILFSKDFHCASARAGIAIYGLWPSSDIRKWADGTTLVPALSWKTIVTEVKLVSKGKRVGYDLTHEAARDSRLAIIPVGYWHGLPRNLSNVGTVLVGGTRAPIVGRVSMDMTIIDVTDIPSVKQGDEAVIIGTQGKETLSAEEVAEAAGTINYEIVTRINPLIPRIEL